MKIDPSLRVESQDLHQCYNNIIIALMKIDPSLRVESSAIINLRGVSTKLNFHFNHIVAKRSVFHCFVYTTQAEQMI